MLVKFRYPAIAIALVFLAGCSTMGGPGGEQAGQANKSDLGTRAAAVLENQMGLSDKKRIPQDLISGAKCIAVFPRIIQAGFILAARRGSGLVSCRPDGTRWSEAAPAVYSITGGSVGLQAGATKSSIILLFETRDSMDSLLTKKLKLGSQIGVTAGPLGFDADVQTTPSPVVSYVADKTGLFAGVNLSGTKLSYSQKANSRIYTNSVKGPRSILLQPNQIPPSLSSFTRTLQTFVKPSS